MDQYVLKSNVMQSTDAALMPFRIVRKMRNEMLFGCQLGEAINDTKWFCITINTYNFKANELMIDLSGNILTIEASRERDHDGNNVKSHFQRRYLLPDDLQNDQLDACLDSNGVLTVTIPKKPFVQQATNF